MRRPPVWVACPTAVMWSGVNVSWPVFADATCYSVVPVIRKTISSFAIAMVCGEGGSHSATVVPAVGRSRLRSSGQWRFWWTSLSRLPRQLRAGRFLSCFRRLTEFRVVLRFRDSFGVSREPLPRRRRLGLTPSGPRRWWRGRGGPPSVEPERRSSSWSSGTPVRHAHRASHRVPANGRSATSPLPVVS